MLPIGAFLTDLVIVTVVFTALVLGSFLWRPRIWLHDFPADIQAMVPPKTDEEKRLSLIFGVPFILAFFGLPTLLMWDLKTTLGADFSFLTAWLYAYALFIGINLWDLLVLDWGMIIFTDPQNPPIVGAEGAAGWQNYRFHFYGFLKGCVIGLVFATIIASLVTLLA